MSKEPLAPGLFRRAIRPQPTYIVTVAGKDGRANPIAIDYLTAVSDNPPWLMMAIMPQRTSYGLLQENPFFVLNVMSYKQAAALMICGRHRGSGEDKFKSSGLTPVPAKLVPVPAILEALAHVECEVLAEYPGGDHVIIVAKVVAAAVDPGVLRSDGLRDIEAAPPIFHIGAGHLTTSSCEDLFIPRDIPETDH
jgi:flavin reductase (DIM6/NTAB) family NADH-FMN oxidoreductase RutF